MQLYNYTLQPPQTVTHAIFGHFSSPKAQELLVAHSHSLELLRPLNDGRVVSVLKTDVFGVIRDLKAFRLPGSSRDFIVLGSDAGKLVILEYVSASNSFEKVHEETFGKTGCRRIVPGQLLAADPKGRAVMVGALEKQKFIYSLNRSSDNRLTISSPLEAHRAHTVVFSMCGVHVHGFDNPVFACIEANYDENDAAPTHPVTGLPVLAKHLVYYELDLGVNTVSRVWSTPLHPGASLVLSVPGDKRRPGGVVVCSEDVVSYYSREREQPLHVPIPRRFDTGDDKTVLITAATVCNIMRKNADMLFFLLQSEYGDIYKLDFDLAASALDADVTVVTDLSLSYFDTLPPAVALCLTDSGFLFAAAETGASQFLRVTAFGDRDEDGAVVAMASTHGALMLQQQQMQQQLNGDLSGIGAGVPAVDDELDGGRTYFAPRPLTNLEFLSHVDSMGPILALKVADLTKERAPQLYAACGRSNRATLKALRHGLALREFTAIELPSRPTAVFTAKTALTQQHHALVALSFEDKTLVLRCEGDSIEEDADTGLLTESPTLLLTSFNEAGPAAAASATGGWLQVTPQCVRLVSVATGKVSNWNAPRGRPIVRCAANDSQLVLSLDGGDLVYLEAEHGNMRDILQKPMGNTAAALALAPVAPGRQRAPFVAVGGHDRTVRVLSLSPDSLLQQLTLQGLPDVPCALTVTPPSTAAGAVSASASAALTLYIGLENGLLVRSSLDAASGQLSDPRRRVLGAAPVRLATVTLGSGVAVIALSSRPWAFYTYAGAVHEAPLFIPFSDAAIAASRATGAAPVSSPITTIAPFVSESFPQGLVATSGASMLILTADALGDAFARVSTPLRYTPRKLLAFEPRRHRALVAAGRAPAAALLVTVEGDDNALPWDVKEEMTAAAREALAETSKAAKAEAREAARQEARELAAATGQEYDEAEAAAAEAAADAEQMEAEYRALELQCGVPQAQSGKWASCIRVVDPIDLSTVQTIEMTNNEVALSAAFCTLVSAGATPAAVAAGDENAVGLYLVVGVVKDLIQLPKRSHAGGALLVYAVSPGPAAAAAATDAADSAAGAPAPRLTFLHRTPVTDVPGAVAGFTAEGLLLAGVGNALRVYELGKRKLLLKSELKVANASMLTSIHLNDDTIPKSVAAAAAASGAPTSAIAGAGAAGSAGGAAGSGSAAGSGAGAATAMGVGTDPLAANGVKVTVGDATTGFYVCQYSVTLVAAVNAVAPSGLGAAATPSASYQRRFAVVAVSPTPRVLSAACCVDPVTLASGDRFGNLTLTRLAAEDADAIDTDPTGGGLRAAHSSIDAATATVRRPPVLMTDVASTFTGDIVTGIEHTALSPGGEKVLVYATMLGAVGVLAPVAFREDGEFLTHLELHLRNEVPSLVGREHLSYRSYYAPVANVVDGDLCEAYAEAYRGHSAAGALATAAAPGAGAGGSVGQGVGLLTVGQLQSVAEELASEPRDVVRRIEEIRQRVI